MQGHDAPAAIVLLAFITGLTCAVAQWPALFVVAILLIAIRRPACGRFAFALAAGMAISGHVAHLRAREDALVFDAMTFTTIDAPLDRGWTSRGTLRVARFTANGRTIDQPLTFYARFAPPPIGMAARIRAQGFLHRSDNGQWSLTIKSSRLLSYRGELHALDPARWNRALAMRIAPLAATHPHEVALVEALALGRSERLDDELRDGFRRGGTYHLLVFSGLQIALAAGVIAWLLRCLHAPRTADWLLLAFSILAPLFIGPTASVSRASIAIALYAIARILKRPTSLENLWCVAALVRLAISPADLAEVAFQLTYAGAGALLFIAKKRSRWIAPVAAELVIVPLTLFHFHQFAIGGSVATIAMTPIVFAMLVVSIATFVFPALIFAITPLHALCTLINDLGAHTSGFCAAPPRWSLVLAAFAALAAIAFLTGGRRAAALALIACLPTLGALLPKPRNEAEMIALDVGQGDSIVVRAGGCVLLVDGGGRSDDAHIGEKQLLPLLVDRGIRRIDVVALTHAHPDHCGGLPAVIENLRVGSVWITPRHFAGECAQRMLDACIHTSTPIHIARNGDRLALGPFHATAFTANRFFRRSPENNSSLVLRVQIESRKLLLTGDIEREAERELAGSNLRCDILKVAHHGSRTSTSAPLLDAAQPRIALISCGRHNLFGHPHATTLDVLRARNIRTWRTDESGSVTFAITGRRIRVSTEIDTHP